jgi:hypothetical protein
MSPAAKSMSLCWSAKISPGHGCLADREDRPLEDQPIVVCAALTRAAAQSLVLLVGDDLEVGAIDAALALARDKARELVTRDQVAVNCVIEELPDCRLHVGVLRSYPRHRFVSEEAVERSIVKLADERPQPVSHTSHGRFAPSGRLPRALTVRPSDLDLAVLVDHCAREVEDGWRLPTSDAIDFLAQLREPLLLGCPVGRHR